MVGGNAALWLRLDNLSGRGGGAARSLRVRFDFLKRDLLFMSDDAQRDQMAALVRITPNLRAVLAAHVALQLMDRRCLRSAHDV